MSKIKWLYRWHDAPMPYQEWREFAPDQFVEIANAYGDVRRGYAREYWWGYEEECGQISEGVIVRARPIERCRVKAGSLTANM